MIAGGSLENGTASDGIYAFVARDTQGAPDRPPAGADDARRGRGDRHDRVRHRRPRRLARHADEQDRRRRPAEADRARRRVARRSRSPTSPRSSDPRGILLAGGHAATGTVSTLTELVPSTHAARRTQTAVKNVYAADRVGNFSPAVRRALPYVYVPNSDSGTVDVIDQRTFKVVDHFAVGALPQHVVPAWDLKTLYVTNDLGNSLTPINPNTGKPGRAIPVDDPYNMYFTPDGRYAIVVAERLHRLDFRDAHTFKLVHSLSVPCSGADHMDFSADGSYAIVSCEFSGQLLKVNIPQQRVDGVLTLRPGAAPQDVKLSPDGAVFYVADMNSNGVWLVDGANVPRAALHADGCRRARALPESRRALPLRDEPRRGLDLGRSRSRRGTS